MNATLALPYVPPSALFRRRLKTGAGLLAGLVIAGVFLGFKPWQLITEFPHLLRLADEMLPPNLALLWTKTSLYQTMLETLSMAFLGTVGGGAISMALATLAARNTSPHPAVRTGVRLLFQLERATPNFILLMVLLVAVGFGPFAGFLSLMLGSIGTIGKLFADAIEQIDPAPAEGVASVGASRWQVIRYAIVPQVLPSMVGSWFYVFDINLRLAIALGIYGGGGLGFELHLAMKVLRYGDVLALILLTVALMLTMERVSDFLRRRLIGGETLK